MVGTLGGIWLGGELTSSNRADQLHADRMKAARAEREKAYFGAYSALNEAYNTYIDYSWTREGPDDAIYDGGIPLGLESKESGQP